MENIVQELDERVTREFENSKYADRLCPLLERFRTDVLAHISTVEDASTISISMWAIGAALCLKAGKWVDRNLMGVFLSGAMGVHLPDPLLSRYLHWLNAFVIELWKGVRNPLYD